ncbi:MAG: NAD-reducing hydrogenase HoxS subunit beta [Phycisphaerae bacterium]|nr:NAD-reducing hydrogenase HoxS subunit beta [Phycisphaerae bacterium]
MSRTITIDPLTRIEGHARITLHLGPDGQVSDALFHVTQFRGFEKFVEGRPFHEMPSIMARICGICPVSHLVASAKACDELLAVRIPHTAIQLRRLMNIGQIVQSHALNFFHLSSPDLLLGFDSDPATRNIFGVLAKRPDLARDGIRLRQFGQQVIEWLGKERIHPAWIVAGGVSSPLTAAVRDRILAAIPEARQIAHRTMDWFKRSLENYREETRTFGNFPSLFLGLVGPDGELEHYDGRLRFVDATGEKVADGIENADYASVIGEAVEPWSYLKFPYYKPTGYPEGMYRVGPLARLNVCDRIGTPEADAELAEFRELGRGAVLSSFHYHFARLVEVIYGIEMIEQILNDPEILSTHVRAEAGPNARRGIGISEAPRGLLIHDYTIDEQGLMRGANLIIATGHNNLAMSRGILQVARRYVDGNNLKEGMLNRVEAVIRAFDPCLSCSTHAAGKMPMRIELFDADGRKVNEVMRQP